MFLILLLSRTDFFFHIKVAWSWDNQSLIHCTEQGMNAGNGWAVKGSSKGESILEFDKCRPVNLPPSSLKEGWLMINMWIVKRKLAKAGFFCFNHSTINSGSRLQLSRIRVHPSGNDSLLWFIKWQKMKKCRDMPSPRLSAEPQQELKWSSVSKQHILYGKEVLMRNKMRELTCDYVKSAPNFRRSLTKDTEKNGQQSWEDSRSR